jgi:hypothetical protein
MKSNPNAVDRTSRSLRERREAIAFPISPSQYYDRRARNRYLDGEERLLFAVLEDAIRQYLVASNGRRRANRRAYNEVKEWVNTPGEHDLFAFDSLCRVFDIDPDSLRKQLNSLGGGTVRLRRFRNVGRSMRITAGD